MANRTTRTPKKEEAFLNALREGYSVAGACAASGVARRTAYDWRNADPIFCAAWEDAVEEGTDELEDEAVKRAKEGSDTLLIFMLKSRRPETYKDRAWHEHTGPRGGPIQTESKLSLDPAKLSLSALEEILNAASDGE